MTKAQIKPWFQSALRLIAAGWIFLILETLFFLARDGWHYYAETQAEKICDIIGGAMTAAGMLVGVCCWFLLVTVAKESKSDNQ